MAATDLTADPDYSLFCHGRLGDPYPLLRRLRDEDPVHWSEPLGSWVLTRYEDIYGAFLDTRLSSQKARTIMNQLPKAMWDKVAALGKHLSMWVSHTDPPDHTRLRQLINVAFSPKVIHRMRPHIQKLVDTLIDNAEARRQMDLITEFAYPLPVTVICEMVGIPSQDRIQFGHWVDDITATTDGSGPERPKVAERSQTALVELSRYLGEIIDQRRRKPCEDLISALVAVEDEGRQLSHDELYAMLVQLLVGGHDTTTALIGNAILSLFRFPKELERLRSNPALIGMAVEEFLRFEAPGPRNTRLALENLQIGGRSIQRGETVLLMSSAANRDPTVFPDPDRLDISRSPNNHLTFGWGIHFCLGAPMARLMCQISVKELLRRFPDIRLAEPDHVDDPPWRESMGLRALSNLPVVF